MRLPFKILKTDVLENVLADNRVLKRMIEDLGWLNMARADVGLEGVLNESRKEMLEKGRIVHAQNPLIGHWVNLDTWFTFGAGMPMPQVEDEQTQEFIREFWMDEDNRIALTSYMAQCALNIKRHVEGELFALMFSDMRGDGRGMTRVRWLDSLEVRDVIVSPDDRNRALAYKRVYRTREYDYGSKQWQVGSDTKTAFYPDYSVARPAAAGLPAGLLEKGGCVFHVKLNCDINDTRGIPEIYRAIPWATSHKDANANLLSFVTSLTRFAWNKTVKGGARAIAASKTKFGAETDMSNPPPSVGSIYAHNMGFDMAPFKHDTGGADAMQASIEKSLLMVCAASGIFEHYYGDPSTGNLATATSMELPMLKKFEASQQLWRHVFGTVVTHAINKAIEVGRLPGTVEYDADFNRNRYIPKAEYELDFDFGPILERNTKEFVDAVALAAQQHLITKKVAAQLTMLVLGVNHIENELEALDEAGRLEDSAAGPESEPPVADGSELGVAAAVEEGVRTPQHSPGKEIAEKSRAVQAAMVGYRKELDKAWSDYKESILSAARAGMTAKAIDSALAGLREAMQRAADRYFRTAIIMGRAYVGLIAPAVPMLKEATARDVLEAQAKRKMTKADRLLERHLARNTKYIEESLIPALREDAMGVVHKRLAGESAVQEVAERLAAKDSRLGQYAGAFWSVEESAVKEFLTGSGMMVNFIGASDTSTCADCSAAMAGNPWPADQAPVPGEDTTCDGNCRHALQIASEYGRS